MQPQDNNQPTNQPQDSTQTSGAMPAAQPLDPQNPMSGGTTIQPQAGGVSSTAPAWQNDAAADASQLYAQPAPAAAGGDSTPQPTAAMPPNPLHDDNPAPQNQPMPNPNEAVANDLNANSLAAQPLAAAEGTVQPAPAMAPPPPATPPTPAPQADMGAPVAPLSEVQQPQAAEVTPPTAPQTANDPYAQAPNQQPPAEQLPGSANLGSAVASLYQPDNPGQQPGMPAQMGATPAASLGPPPKKSKALIFIIVGVVIGLIAIAGGVFFFLRNRTASNTQTTPTPTPSPTPQPAPESAPTSGPATPPSGYVTITKQCYTFALYDPNTVPADQTCSFADATFGKLNVSKIGVQTTTEAYKTIDEYLALFEPTVTVVEKKDVSLDGQTGKQVIYKATDGKTYSQVAVLIVGKNYQQEGKAVTGLALTTSYQEAFDQEVTANVISTWRWK